jgi:hypothetical protein
MGKLAALAAYFHLSLLRVDRGTVGAAGSKAVLHLCGLMQSIHNEHDAANQQDHE